MTLLNGRKNHEKYLIDDPAWWCEVSYPVKKGAGSLLVAFGVLSPFLPPS